MSDPKRPGGERLTRRELLASLAGAGLAAAGVARAGDAAPGAAAAAQPPNIVFVLSDNHRWDAMGAAGHPFVRDAPTWIAWRAEGLHFENAFCTTPLCSPARASFLTGQLRLASTASWNHAEHAPPGTTTT